LAVAQQLPHGSCQAGDRHLKIHETRDNLQTPDADQVRTRCGPGRAARPPARTLKARDLR